MAIAPSTSTPRATVVHVAGELDLFAAPQLRQRLVDIIERGSAHLALDLSEVTFIDSTGLGVLVGALKRARGYGGDLSLRAVPPSVLKVFEITGLTKVFWLEP